MFGLKKIKKKGQVSFGGLPGIVSSVGLAVLFMAAMAVALVAFQNSGSVTTNIHANQTITNGLTFLTNLSGQLGTVGVMIGVGLIILAVVSAFFFLRGKGGGI